MKLTSDDTTHRFGASGADVPVIAELLGGLVLILGLVLGLLISGRGAPRI